LAGGGGGASFFPQEMKTTGNAMAMAINPLRKDFDKILMLVELPVKLIILEIVNTNIDVYGN
jgi:hypothetical protein